VRSSFFSNGPRQCVKRCILFAQHRLDRRIAGRGRHRNLDGGKLDAKLTKQVRMGADQSASERASDLSAKEASASWRARCKKSLKIGLSMVASITPRGGGFAKTDHFIACKNFRASPNKA
jgi:hypothetical protein